MACAFGIGLMLGAASAFAQTDEAVRGLRTAHGRLQRGLNEEAAAEYRKAIGSLDDCRDRRVAVRSLADGTSESTPTSA